MTDKKPTREECIEAARRALAALAATPRRKKSA